MSRINLYQTPEHDCPYLPDKQAITQFIDPDKTLNVELYTYLSSFGFRRSGEHLYRPSCNECKACVSVRLPVNDMPSTKSQRRILNRASQFNFHHIDAVDSDEHFDLYERYINTRHKNGDMYPATRKLFRSFLLSGWANTQFMEIRDDTTLIGCAVYDRIQDGLSAVYCYFDPDYAQFSPGKLAILKQIQFSKENQLQYLYLGYQIDDCVKMNYKNKYRPVEEFINMQWIRTD
jgi:arginine-tRNA-protein transferase